jgi:hypothetical protein
MRPVFSVSLVRHARLVDCPCRALPRYECFGQGPSGAELNLPVALAAHSWGVPKACPAGNLSAWRFHLVLRADPFSAA